MRDRHDLESIKKELSESECIPGLYIADNGDRYLPCYNYDDRGLVNWHIITTSGKRQFIVKSRRFSAFSYIGVIDRSKPVAIYSSYEEAVKAFIAFGITAFFSLSRIGNRKLRRLLESKGFNIVLADMLTIDGKAIPATDKDNHSEIATEEQASDIVPTSLDIPINSNDSDSPIGQVYSGEQMSQQMFDTGYLVRDVIPSGELLGFIFGPSGSGKTFIILDMLLFVASGFPSWHGIIIHQAKILYVAGESYKAINQRIASFSQTYGTGFYENFYTYFLDVPISLPEGFALLQSKIDSGEIPFSPDIIVLDTLNCFFDGDENKSDEAARFKTSRLIPLQKKYHCNILTVTHSSKANEAEIRGSTAIKAFADYSVFVHRDNQSPDQILVDIDKNRMGEEIPVMRCRIEKIQLNGWQPDEDGITPRGGIIECLENLVSGVDSLEDKAIARLEILKKAIVEYGDKCVSGDWFITGDSFRQYMKDREYSENDIKKTFCYSDNRFFPELIDKYYVKVERSGEEERRKIERIVILPPALNKELDIMHLKHLKKTDKAE